MKTQVAVIIPYYQRAAGILPRAVRSVLDQKNIPGSEVIVIDDCSPISANSELNDLVIEYPDRIRIIQMQQNRGQGAARNKGLDCVRTETEYVAFLDSDDLWSQNHLSNALYALDRGFDVYFSDFYQLNQTVSAFDRAKRIDPRLFKRLPGSETVHSFHNDMFSQIIKGNILGMSTIVYRFSKFPVLRFHEDFRSCGEEYLFWLDLAKRTERFAFSSEIECHYGEGVNTYSGATWGRDGAIRKLHDEIRYLQRIGKAHVLTPDQASHIKGRISKIRVEVIAEILHRLAHKKRLDTKLLVGVIKMDIRSLLFSVPIAIKIVLASLKNRWALWGATPK